MQGLFGKKLRLIIFYALNPLPDEKILDWSKLKQSADDNFEFKEIAESSLTW